MKNCKPVLRVLAGALTFACTATAADAPKLTFKFTTINVKGSQSTNTFAINNEGVMVGIYIDSSGILHGLKLVGGKATNIDDPKATQGTYCYGINSSGAIVGAYGTSGGGSQGFLYQGGKFTDVGPAGSPYSEARGITDKGEIVGNYIDSSGVEVGFPVERKKKGHVQASASPRVRLYRRRKASTTAV